jgi:hypothetical protein
MNTIAQIFHLPLLTTGFLLFIAFITVIFHIYFKERTIDFGPTILTTTGIFATFLGIAIGLSEFNVHKVGDSVPALLEGLKTAFWASVAGVGGALTLKYRHYFFGVKSNNYETDYDSADASVVDVVRELSAIKMALAGGEDASLLSQIKLLRSDTNDRLDNLKKAQTEALQMLSKMGSEAMIEALREVIRDFNSRINEQFGENFKHLNEAVGNLLIWQEQHKQHVETMSARLIDIANVAREATENHKNIVDQTSMFSKTAADLSSLLIGLETQKSQLIETAKQLGILLTKASDGLPKIEEQITSIADQMAKSVTETVRISYNAILDNAENIKQSIEKSNASQDKAHEAHLEKLLNLADKSETQLIKLTDNLSQAVSKGYDTTKTHIEGHSSNIKKLIDGSMNANTRIYDEQTRQMGRIAEQSKETFIALGDKLGQALTDSADMASKSQSEQINRISLTLESFKVQMTNLEQTISNAAQSLVNSAIKNQEITTKAIEETGAGIQKTIDETIRNSSTVHDEQMKQISQLVAKSKEQIDTLDAALAEELSKALEALGGQLAALSEKFVDDYTPLTIRLRELVRMAEQRQ